MLFNELRVVPAFETLDYLSMVFSGSPLPLHPESWSVVINQSTYEMEPRLSNVYIAYVETINVWYDDLTGQAQLIMVLDSEDLTERCLELRETAPNPFHRSYYPHMILLSSMPQIKRRYRAMINSWGDSLTRDKTPLIFDNEIVSTTDREGTPEINFYADMDRRYNMVR